MIDWGMVVPFSSVYFVPSHGTEGIVLDLLGCNPGSVLNWVFPGKVACLAWSGTQTQIMSGPLACWHQQCVVLLSLGLMVSLLASLLPICSDPLLCIDGNFSATRNKSPNSACLNEREDFLSPITRSPKVGGKTRVFWQSFHSGLSFGLFFPW